MFVMVLGLSNCTSHMLTSDRPVQPEGVSEQDDEVLIRTFEKYGMTIIGFKGNFEIIYDPTQPLSLYQTAENDPYSYLINGSYFEGSRIHAGWLSIFGDQHAPIKDDRQLSHMAILDTSLGYLDFPGLDLWDSSMTGTSTIEFQTGPLVIYENQIDTLSIKASINGMTSHLRTFLAYTEEDGMKYFIITRQVGPLDKIAEHLLSLPVFNNKALSVMNLDGGSSTALFSREHPELNFNVNRPLPILLGIR